MTAAAPNPALTADRLRALPPDAAQLLAATLLLGLGAAPLFRWLDLQVGLFVLALLLLRLAVLRWPRLQPGRFVLLGLTLLGVANVVDAYRVLAGQDAGTALLVSMIALKLLETRTRRDLRVLSMVFVFLLVILFLFDQALWLTVWLSLLLVANVALLADLNGAPTTPRVRRAGRTALVLTTQALPLALLLFVLFPRLDAPLWDLGLGRERGKTGLKDWLEPGSVGELVISGEDAFRVRFDEPPPVQPQRMYWRGPVLWRTDGRRWLPLPGIYREPPPSTPGAQGRPVPRSLAGAGRDAITALGPAVHYTVMLEPSDQRTLPVLDLPLTAPAAAWITTDFQLLAARPLTDWTLYRVTSALDYRTTGPDDPALPRTADGLDPTLAAAALQLPDNVTARMRELVADWRRGGADDRTLIDRALAYFNAPPFRYTLVPPVLGANPADEFLFETQAGFCEHYASSFVLLMRLAGIPARIVLGYLGGDYNGLSGDYLIRQSDAHAWAEVWLAEDGWVRVDPTSAIAPERIEADARMAALGAAAPVRFRVDQHGLLARFVYELRTLAGAINSGWKHWIIGFSSLRQRRLLDELGIGPLREYGLVLLLLVLGGVVMGILSLLLGRERPRADAAAACFARACRRLARIGLPRAPREGPLDYRARVIAARPDLAPALDALLAPYLALHYQGRGDARALAELRARVRAFRPARRQRRG